MKTIAWIDHGVTPPAPLPDGPGPALAYLADILGHVVYERWTFTRFKHLYPSLADAKRAKPAVFRLLLAAPAVVEFWERGRVRILPQTDAPSPDTVLERLLRTHHRRFKPARDQFPVAVPGNDDMRSPLAALDTSSPHTTMWLARSGRFVNRHADTNTLAVADDAQAVALFLRDRASRSRHTFRAYASELRRLIQWCEGRQSGPLSDLTRNDLFSYRDALRGARAESPDGGGQRVAIPSDRTTARALAVVASLYQYWCDTGYLSANPAAGLVTGAQPRAVFAPQRFVPAEILAACDAWIDQASSGDGELDIALVRRQAIWALYRYSGVRLAELTWSIGTGLPRIEAEGAERWTLYVSGKGQKLRAIPLPTICIAVLRKYRLARGLSSEPKAHEQLPLIHGFKGGSLQEVGLYREVKTIFDAVADRIEQADSANATLLRASSPHWLRHAYAKTLVVDHKVPLPVAQALLGHASVQTTAAYAKTDLSQLRAFVEASFVDDK